MDLLENTSTSKLTFGENLEQIWEELTGMLRVVEAAGGIVFNQKNKIPFIQIRKMGLAER